MVVGRDEEEEKGQTGEREIYEISDSRFDCRLSTFIIFNLIGHLIPIF